jgi:hypothetical protein
VFIKDITHYLLPPNSRAAAIAPSLSRVKRGVGTNGLPIFEDSPSQEGKDVDSDHDSGVALTPSAGSPSSGQKSPPFPYKDAVAEPSNPTVVPREILEKFHFTFLIRHPKNSIPSYYRCCISPLVERTKFEPFMPEEAGYDELRRMFDYLKDTGLVGPKICGQENAEGIETKPGGVEICVLDADDMLDDPAGVLKQYCASVGMEFDEAMLKWDTPESHAFAKEQFEKWNGFHDDAINSTDLKPRAHVSSFCLFCQHCPPLSTFLTPLVEARHEERCSGLRGIGREVWQGGRRRNQGDGRQEHRRLRVSQAVCYQDLKAGFSGIVSSIMN